MAQPIAPEKWVEGIRFQDNSLLPDHLTNQFFKGSNPQLKSIANCGEACRVWDMITTDYITTYDDRRLNGLAMNGDMSVANGFNADGRDGWGASAYGVFQDVKFDSRVYTMGRHRSVAFRIFEEQQYGGTIGFWGTATASSITGPGASLMKVAAQITEARSRWEKEILGVDMDKYNLFAAVNGHISGRVVGKTQAIEDHVFTGDAKDYKWVAQPGTVQGQPIPPRFAPIHCIQWDNTNIPLFLSNLEVTWNNLYIPKDNRIILLDPYYRYQLMAVLTGTGVPATESAYSDVREGTFTRLMGWTFNFDIPQGYWPKIYVDDNLNVIHGDRVANLLDSDKGINSIAGESGKPYQLLQQLLASNRMAQDNWVRTDWDATNGFYKTVTNYPLGTPAMEGYYGTPAKVVLGGASAGTVSDYSSGSSVTVTMADPYANPIYNGSPSATNFAAGHTLNEAFGTPTTYPWTKPGTGYGLPEWNGSSSGSSVYPTTNMATGPVITSSNPGYNSTASTAASATVIDTQQVIGLALYQNAVQCSQEYSGMVTAEGSTRGKFTEMCYDIKYDCWVIEQYSAGVLPILAPTSADYSFSIPVSIAGGALTIESSETSPVYVNDVASDSSSI